LSYTTACGKPVVVCVGVPDGVCVSVWLGVCVPDALAVRDGVTLGVNVTLPEDVGVGDGEQSVFMPVSKMPRYGDAAVHVVPAFALVQLARAFARVPDGMDAAPALHHDTLLDAEMTSAYVVPRIPDVSKSIDDRGR